MSKVIKVTDEIRAKLLQEFAAGLEKYKSPNGEFNFTSKLNSFPDKAELHFTEQAYIKMMMLVYSSNNEVGWHGIARRDNNSVETSYTIEDILVYPQTVTGTHVDTDEKKYTQWLYSLPDESFERLRFQGHSHVNMSTTPSSTDRELYHKLLGDIPEDEFYIFLIINKRGEFSVFIYDLLKNRLFETGDVKLIVDDGDMNFNDFTQSAKDLVKNETALPKKETSVQKYNSNNDVKRADGYTPKYPYSWYDGAYGSDDYRDW